MSTMPAADHATGRETRASYLQSRGFSDDAIREVGWRVEPVGASRCGRYGLPKEAAEAIAWVIPYRHPNGKVAFERLRLIDDRDLARFGGGKYRQPAGRPLSLYDPYGALEGPQDAVLVIEGEANAVAVHAVRPDLAVVGLPGQTALTEPMARDLGHVPLVWIWIDQHDKGAVTNATRIARRLREAGVEDVRQLEDAAGVDANEALRELGAPAFTEVLATMLDRAEPIVPTHEGWPSASGKPVPSFPLEALPVELAQFVDAVSVETQTPPDLAGLVALNVLSAVALGTAVVDCGNWEEELGLYTLVVMPSGDRKSAVLRTVLAPLRDLEREWRDAAGDEIRDKQTRQEMLQVRRTRLIRKAGELEDADERRAVEADLVEAVEELERIGDPVMPRLLADDATPEALAGLLARHGRIAVLSAEAAILDNLVGRYDASGSANLHLVCKAYTGEETRVDRRGRDPELLERPLLTLLVTAQPHVLRALVEHPTARAQGLVGRFAYAIPESQLGSRAVDAPSVPADRQAAWAAIVRRVNSAGALTEPTQADSVGSVSNREIQVSRLSLSPSARRRLDALRRELEPRLAEGADLRDVSDWIARHPGRIARLAGLLHLIQYSPRTPISEATMNAALQIGEYLLGHALAALKTPDELTRRAVDWLRRQDERTVSERQLHRGPLGGRGAADKAHRLAQVLVELGVLRLIEAETPRSPGRPPSPSYDVNPNLRDPR